MTEEEYAIDYLKKYIETDMIYENRHYKQIELVLNLIQKQDTEINKLNNVIDRMAEVIEKHLNDFYWYEIGLETKNKQDIKEFFMNERW